MMRERQVCRRATESLIERRCSEGCRWKRGLHRGGRSLQLVGGCPEPGQLRALDSGIRS